MIFLRPKTKGKICSWDEIICTNRDVVACWGMCERKTQFYGIGRIPYKWQRINLTCIALANISTWVTIGRSELLNINRTKQRSLDATRLGVAKSFGVSHVEIEKGSGGERSRRRVSCMLAGTDFDLFWKWVSFFFFFFHLDQICTPKRKKTLWNQVFVVRLQGLSFRSA